jgi:hypothetical protein
MAPPVPPEASLTRDLPLDTASPGPDVVLGRSYRRRARDSKTQLNLIPVENQIASRTNRQIACGESGCESLDSKRPGAPLTYISN